MTDFTMSVAGITIGVSALHPSTKKFCGDYLTHDAPDFSVALSQSDIDAERERSEKYDELKGGPIRRFSDRYLETLALYRRISLHLPDYDTVIFHGSVVAVGGRAYAFTAPSGTGKTTHTRLWLDRIPDSHVLNGDKPLLRLDGDTVLACGTPWQGKENYGRNEILPLAAICILERAEDNTIVPVTSSEALGTLIKQTHRPDETDLLLKTLSLVGRIGSAVKLYRLGCNTEPEAALVSYSAMTGDGEVRP